ncbi:pyridoxal 5'-phosphate synthase glutaminase subunit PdxT [Clostridium sp. D53t1_180928_C8]|uniref:pyridoxal 5'-phosphate synthase glutaminase subunit PdxT n=1 Tax=Clostridium sp. D53t1_180928_C8 TaxID=2787101 RepID=UPI0018AB7BE0|nr:pyridoxal 5'-phosphate synthase glutaminase subunit PdxT [Clostridium sp. D53t1_180928_C8]
MKIGVLSLQGGVIEHVNAILSLGHEAIGVKSLETLKNIDTLIIPGGESTTVGKLLNPLQEMIQNGLPVWGTCASMILLSKNIENEETSYLHVIDITVKRNAYGTQLDSFTTNTIIKEISKYPIELVFIRATYITAINPNVSIIAIVDNNIVSVRQDNMLATSFHPELTNDTSFLKYFIEKVAHY